MHFAPFNRNACKSHLYFVKNVEMLLFVWWKNCKGNGFEMDWKEDKSLQVR